MRLFYSHCLPEMNLCVLSCNQHSLQAIALPTAPPQYRTGSAALVVVFVARVRIDTYKALLIHCLVHELV
jgi:hypothetical protein